MPLARAAAMATPAIADCAWPALLCLEDDGALTVSVSPGTLAISLKAQPPAIVRSA